LPIDDPQLIEERTLGDFFTGLKIQTRVLHALIIRAMMARYGRKNIGFLWLMLEPMLLCAGVIALRWLTQAHEERGVSLVSVVLSGYMPLTLWRHFTGKSTFIIRDSIGMLYHRQLTILDMFLMTMILEFMGCTLASIINYNALRVMGAIEPIQDYGYVIEGWCLMAILAMGVGSAIAVLVEKYEAGERFIGPLQYCLLPLCGCFYMVYWLPSVGRISLFIYRWCIASRSSGAASSAKLSPRIIQPPTPLSSAWPSSPSISRSSRRRATSFTRFDGPCRAVARRWPLAGS
jgi:capsular polysaccharide transport system permease protein